MKKYEISVVMLIYNTPKQLLEKSINSVLNQTQKNIEIILVNDCSTNQETLDTLKDFEKKYENIKIANHEINHGMLRGRLTGVENSTADYVSFLDSDDTMSQDYLRTMLNCAKQNDADIVISPFLFDYDDTKTKTYLPRDPFNNKIFDLKNEEIIDAYMNQQGKLFTWNLNWNKVFKKELLKKTYDDLFEFCKQNNGLNMTEDIAFTLPAFIHAKKLVSCKGEAVNYFKHSGQSINVSSYKKWQKSVNDVAAVFKFMGQELEKNNLLEKHKANFEEWKKLYVRTYKNSAPGNENSILKMLLKDFEIENYTDVDRKRDDTYYCYYYMQENDITGEYNEKENLIKGIQSKETDVVSFDVFDTLLLRNVFEPKDIFRYLSVEYNKISNLSYCDFSDLRIKAEEETRKIAKQEEITLDEIYDYIEKKYLFSHEMCEFLKSKEKELELKFIRPREFGKKLFDIAKYVGKKVIITSDIYFDKNFVAELLTKCGYDLDGVELFVSSNIKLTKHTGKLFDYITKTLKVKSGKCLHIGDNWHSDFLMPQKKGWKSLCLPNVNHKFNVCLQQKLFAGNDLFIRTQSFGERLLLKSMLALVQNELFDNPFLGFDQGSVFNSSPSTLGYFAVGMELVALNQWLKEKSENYDQIHFVARDGYLPMKAFEVLKDYDVNLPKINYLYVSRKALFPLDITCQEDLRSIPAKMGFDSASVKFIANIFKNDSVDTEKLKKLCKNEKIDYDKKFETLDELYHAISLFTDDVVDYKKHREYCSEIVKKFKEIISPNSRFFDIGYSGRAESIFAKILGYPIDSLYIHTNLDNADIRANMAGFKIDCFKSYPPKVTGTIREHIFMKSAPSIIEYKMKNGELEYVFEKYNENEATLTTTKIVQDSALSFVKDFYDNFYEYISWLSFQNDFICYPYEMYLNNPYYCDKAIFSCVQFEDDLGFGVKKLIDVWITDEIGYLPKTHASQKIENILKKIFPAGSRRRKFAKKVYNFLKKVKNKLKRKK